MVEIITFISHIAFNYLIPVVMVFGFVTVVLSSILCLHFNYHYFIYYGKILWDMADDCPAEAGTVAKVNSLKWKIGVLDAVLAPTIFTAIGLVASIMWPITLIFLILLALLQIQKFVFRGRHRKLKFELKLKGQYHD